MIDTSTTHRQNAIAIDYVVDGERTAASVARGSSRLLGVSYALPGEEPRFASEDVANTLRCLGDRPRVYHDAVFCCAVEVMNDLPLSTSFDDTRIMLHLLQEEPPAELVPQKPRRGLGDEEHVSASLARVRSILASYQLLSGRIQQAGLEDVYRRIEIPVIAPTLAMTLGGLRVNREFLGHAAESHSVQMEVARRQLQELAGRDINLDSQDDVAAYLFDELDLPVTAYNKNGQPSTNKASLEQLAGIHPAVDAALAYRQHHPVQTAAARLLTHVDPSSGRIFADLDPYCPVTGRFSCRSPNLQSIARPVLAAIAAAPGHVLLEIDISQCELRVLAHFSQDARLLDAYCTTAVDVHRRTAGAVLGLPEVQVSDQQRNHVGKRVNFAVVYGMTAVELSSTINTSVDKAQQFLNDYFTAYPGVQLWIGSVHEFARAHGYVRTLSGRRRLIPEVWSEDPRLAAGGFRQCVNTIIQGTSADIIKLALIRLNDALPTDVSMLTTCHDSVLLEVPQGLVSEVEKMATDVMQATLPGFSVPLVVDVGIGRTWADCKAS